MKYVHNSYRFLFTDECLVTLSAQRQVSCISRENGGQLFARFADDTIRVEVATITKGRSKRARFGFWPDRIAEQADIAKLFDLGLHYVGDWHTHPEVQPTPSPIDKTKVIEIFRQSTHELPAMLIVIVGQAPFPKGLYVGAVSTEGVVSLHTDAP